VTPTYRNPRIAWGTACSAAALLVGGFAASEKLPSTIGWEGLTAVLPFYGAVILAGVWLWRTQAKLWTGVMMVLLVAASVFALEVFLLDSSMADAGLGTLRVVAISSVAVIVPMLLDWQPFWRRKDKVRFPRRGWKPGIKPRRSSVLRASGKTPAKGLPVTTPGKTAGKRS
jgi:hypothetical protein